MNLKLLFFLGLLCALVTAQRNLTLSKPDSECQTGHPNGYICCHDICDGCGYCTGDPNVDALCCSQRIVDAGYYCNVTEPPCILDHEIKPDDGDGDDDAWNINDKALLGFRWWHLIMLIGIAVVITTLVVISCCCFGSSRPPVPYEDIIGKYD